MKLIEFMNRYPDEQSCKSKWKEIRIKQGVVCPACGCTEYWWKSDKECFECKHCHHRQSLRAGTIMHGSQLPFRYWFIAMHLLTSTKKSISASELQRQLGHKNYNPVWAMLHKIRMAMGKTDSRYTLAGTVELDEGFFLTEVAESEKEKPLKRGRGSQKKPKVLVIPHDQIGKLLPWVHVAIRNAKRLLLDIFHDISPEYLQSYLNEFCYKFNRRFFGDGLFDRMLQAGVAYKNEFKYNIK